MVMPSWSKHRIFVLKCHVVMLNVESHQSFIIKRKSVREDTGHLTEFELHSAAANFSAVLNWQTPTGWKLCILGICFSLFCSCKLPSVLCRSQSYLFSDWMPVWTNWMNGHSLLWFFFLSAHQFSFSEWSSIVIIAYITLDHFTAQSIHISVQ